MPHHAQKTVKATLFTALLFLSFFFSNCRMSQQTQNTQYANSSSNVSSNTANDPLTIHRRAIAIDMHADTTQRMVDEHLDINQRLADGQLDAVRMKEGGLDAQFSPSGSSRSFMDWEAKALSGAQTIRSMLCARWLRNIQTPGSWHRAPQTSGESLAKESSLP